MNVEEAKAVKMVHGKWKDTCLGRIPSFYLKWLAKNWIRKDIRDAAIIVVNARGQDLGEELNFKPTYQLKSTPRVIEKVDYGDVFFGDLRTLLDESPPGLF